VSVHERIAAWAGTYAGDDVITRYAVLARDELLAAVARTEDRLNAGELYLPPPRH
jgi:hypothetical protein